MQLPFQRLEYQQRLQSTKEAMSRAGVDVLLVSSPANMCYLTGYTGWSFYVHQLVIVVMDESEPFWFGRRIDANAARVTTYLGEENIFSYADHWVQSPTGHPMEVVGQLLQDKGWSGRRLGVEMDSYYYTARAHQCLTSVLAGTQMVDCTSLVNWVRVIKSPQEIEYMRQAGAITALAMGAAINSIAAGVRQSDAVANIYHAQIQGTSMFGGDYPSIVPLLPTGVGTSTPHITWSDAPYKKGEATIIELAGCRLRYHAPLARTVHLGEPPQKLTDTAKVVLEGVQAALDAVAPGVLAAEVEAAWSQCIARYGFIKESRIGYSTGLGFPPDWGEHSLSLRPGDHTPLQANMTIHMIPGLWLDDWGIAISETFRVTETGAEVLVNFPRELVVKP